MGTMSLAEEEAIKIFNDFQLSGPSDKPKLLKSLIEVVVRREPSLIDTFLTKVLEFQVDKSAAVRKGVLDFYDASLSNAVSVQNLLYGVECISFLLEDENVSVVKRSMLSLLSIFQYTLAIATLNKDSVVEDGNDLWKAVQIAVKKVENLIKDKNASTGSKLSASKFLEQALLFATAEKVPPTPPVLQSPGILGVKDSIVTRQDALKLGNEMLLTFICLLKDVKQSENHGPLAISCIRSASQILQSKPQFAGKILPVLLSFSQLNVYQNNEKIVEALNSCLRLFGSLDNRLVIPWRKKISDALVLLGMEPLPSKDSLSGLKRSRNSDLTPSASRTRIEGVKYGNIQVEKYDEQIKSLLLVYDAEGLFNLIQEMPTACLIDLALQTLNNKLVPKVSHHADLITDKVCNLMLTSLKRGQHEKEIERILPTKVFKDPLNPPVLDAQEASYHRIQTLRRILLLSEGSATRIRLVARLATIFPQGDNAFDTLVESILEDYHGRQGHEIFCLLLTMLFAELTNESGQDVNGLFHGSRYENALQLILEGMHKHLAPSDNSLPSLLLEIPAISSEILIPLLREMLEDEGGWENTALVIARDGILHRPRNREELLDFALQSCTSKKDSVRIKSIRMCTNQLYGHEKLQSKMEADALRFLGRSHQGEIGEEEARLDSDRYTSLYCALCTKNSALLRGLFDMFSSLESFTQGALLEKCPHIAESLGPNDKNILNIIQNPPEGSDTLIMGVIKALSTTKPPKALVESTLVFFGKCQDPICIIPILPSLPKTDAIRLIPSLIQLPEAELVDMIDRLCTVKYKEQAAPVITPAEILAVLHMVDDKKLLKYAMTAINTCLAMTEYFTSEVLAASLSQLITRIPLPQLFMRTVLQSLSVAPKLKDFIVGILGQLASKQIWTNSTQWKGWLMAVQQTAPESFPIILRLPPATLDQALGGLHENVRKNLVNFGLSHNSLVELSESSMKVLSKYS